MSGSSIGGVIGGIIGFAIGGPAGAQLGFTIGSIAGGIIKPQVIRGPKLADAKNQTASPGIPRPVVYGHPAPFAGNLIGGELKARKITVKKKSGKGGPVVKEDHYLLTSAIRICEGPIGGVVRIWRNGVVIYDRRQPQDIPGYNSNSGNVFQYLAQIVVKTASSKAKIRIYLGTETQTPDSALEAIYGVGNTPYFRGTAYMVIEDDDVTDTGGACAQYLFEVFSENAGTTVTPNDSVPTPTFQWLLDDAIAGGTAIESIQGYNGAYSASGISSGPPLTKGSGGSVYFTSRNGYMLADYASQTFLATNQQTWTIAITVQPDGIDYGTVSRCFFAYWSDELVGWEKFLLCDDHDNPFAPVVRYTLSSNVAQGLTGDSPISFNAPHRICATRDGANLKLYLDGKLIKSRNDASTIGDKTGLRIAVGGEAYPNSSGWSGYAENACIWDGIVLNADQVAEDFLANEFLDVPDASGAYWDFREREFRVAQLGHTYYSISTLSVRDVCEDVCSRCGVDAANMDFASLDSYVIPGFLVANQDAGADVLSPLMQAFFFDVPEVDRKLTAVVRGGVSAFTLTESDLIDTGDDDPITRPQEIDYPAKLSVITQEPSADYAAVPQTSIRRSPDVSATSEVQLQLAIPFDADNAAQIAEKAHKVTWTMAEGRFEGTLPEEFSIYVVSDCFEFDSRRWLITKTDYADGQIKIEAVRDRASAYSSTKFGVSAAEAPPLPVDTVLGPTIGRLVNLPSLNSSDNVSGLYAFAQGVVDGWPGCDIQISTDGGITYTTYAEITRASVMGYLFEDMPSGGDPLTVSLYLATDELDSATTAQVDAGANHAAIVDSADNAEIISFESATMATSAVWHLDVITQGLSGTTAVTHYADEKFISLDYPTFIPLPASFAGTTLYYRFVTKGTAVDTAPIQTISFDPPTYIIDGGEV